MDQSKPKSMTLKQVLEAADRAVEQVSEWPEWKRQLSTTQASANELTQPASTSSTKVELKA